MLTRRGLFGFAAGGAVAAPTLLKGEQARATAISLARAMPLIQGEALLEPPKSLSVSIQGAEGDAHVRQFIRQAVAQALAEYSDQQRRGGFSTSFGGSAHRSSYGSRKA
ncbi:hypothetical protein FBZ98_1011036 [Rhizobium sp. ERR 922]|uniref:hypothetical protein n=1 Tax=unclassified Rhizobium TaxID=2613769 RepID=UPI00119E4BCB|nr:MULTISPECIES: hypothetical protein [unclassified Rhizobium]TWB61691.1 hypothetical protein FBZ98_1011036 [Rhizobium sp. ERR 922]TWC04617.1 hypothetical protein FBZ97_1011036 [Rhizobium sp. ERR 942]